MADRWIDVDRQGLANTLSALERRRLVEEAVQNALDTDATSISVDLTLPKRGYSTLTVVDDCPTGFKDISLAYRMFAHTDKRSDPEKAGRFTIGEKKILAMSRAASIKSTKGMVVFSIAKGRESRKESKQRTKRGTEATFELQMDDAQYSEVCRSLGGIIPRDGVNLTVNGDEVRHRTPETSLPATLQTEAAGKDGRMSRFQRATEVRLYDPLPGETPCLYELGIPVVEIDCQWHIDVRQRVPLNSDRDNVPPKYLKTLLAIVLNHAHGMLKPDEAAKPWVKDARGSEIISKEAFETTNKHIWGEKAVVPDPGDLESVHRAVAEGYSVIRGATAGEYENNRRFSTAMPSSTLFPTPKPYSDDPNAPVVKIIPENEWTDGMRKVHAYTVALGKKLLGANLMVKFVDTSNAFQACFGKETREMDYNCRALGKGFFSNGITKDVDGLIIHEFGHFYESNHLDERYYEALCQVGAKLKELAIREPGFFTKF